MTPSENPFAAERLANLPFRFPPGQSWATLLERCAAVGYCGAIVGHQGSGKSTVLRQLAPHLEALGFRPHLISLSTESRHAEKDGVLAEVRRMQPPEVLLLDGAEQLSTRQWLPLRGLVDALAGCIVTVHRTSRLPTLLETDTSAVMLEQLVADLTGSHLAKGEAALIHARHRGNLRTALRELHDRWAG